MLAEAVRATASCVRSSPGPAGAGDAEELCEPRVTLDTRDKARSPMEDVDDSDESCLSTAGPSSTITLCSSVASKSPSKLTLFWSELPDPMDRRLCSESERENGLGFCSSGSGECCGMSRNWLDRCDPDRIFIDFMDLVDLLDFLESDLRMKFDLKALGGSSMLKVGLSTPEGDGSGFLDGSLVLRLERRLKSREPA